MIENEPGNSSIVAEQCEENKSIDASRMIVDTSDRNEPAFSRDIEDVQEKEAVDISQSVACHSVEQSIRSEIVYRSGRPEVAVKNQSSESLVDDVSDAIVSVVQANCNFTGCGFEAEVNSESTNVIETNNIEAHSVAVISDNLEQDDEDLLSVATGVCTSIGDHNKELTVSMPVVDVAPAVSDTTRMFHP